MWPIVLLSLYSALVVFASMLGGWLPTLVRLTHTRGQVLVSGVGGLMLGVALLHLLPHAAHEMHNWDRMMSWTLMGLLGTFFLIRVFHFHSHDIVVEEGPALQPAAVAPGGEARVGEPATSGGLPVLSVVSPTAPSCEHFHDHDHGGEGVAGAHAREDGHQHHHHHHPDVRGTKYSWIGIFLGLSLHTLSDGIALAASVEADARHGAVQTLLGLGTFLAVLLHKPLDAMSITSVMAIKGWSHNARQLVNAGFAMMCPLGGLLFHLGMQAFTDSPNEELKHLVLGCALSFSAGVFLCISLADLLPEVQFHSHDRLKFSIALMFGVGLAYMLGFLEPEHAHQHVPQHQHVPPKMETTP